MRQQGNRSLYGRIAAVFVAAATLAACGSARQLDENPAEIVSFDVGRPYVAVFRDMRSYARRCIQQGMITAHEAVDADLYPDERRAVIAVYLVGGLGQQHHVNATIAATSPLSTHVDLKFWSRDRRPVFDGLRPSASGQPPACPPFM